MLDSLRAMRWHLASFLFSSLSVELNCDRSHRLYSFEDRFWRVFHQENQVDLYTPCIVRGCAQRHCQNLVWPRGIETVSSQSRISSLFWKFRISGQNCALLFAGLWLGPFQKSAVIALGILEVLRCNDNLCRGVWALGRDLQGGLRTCLTSINYHVGVVSRIAGQHLLKDWRAFLWYQFVEREFIINRKKRGRHMRQCSSALESKPVQTPDSAIRLCWWRGKDRRQPKHRIMFEQSALLSSVIQS